MQAQHNTTQHVNMKIKSSILAATLLGVAGANAAGVIIDENNLNGGFVTTATGSISSGSIANWTVSSNVFTDANSTLTSGSFGAETLSNTQSLHIFTAGTTVTSDTFALVAGETLFLEFDLRDANAIPGQITVAAVGASTINLGTFDAVGGFALQSGSAAITTAGNYSLVFTDVGGNDLNIDRVHLSSATTAVPEPSSTALLGLGGLTLIMRRRK